MRGLNIYIYNCNCTVKCGPKQEREFGLVAACLYCFGLKARFHTHHLNATKMNLSCPMFPNWHFWAIEVIAQLVKSALVTRKILFIVLEFFYFFIFVEEIIILRSCVCEKFENWTLFKWFNKFKPIFFVYIYCHNLKTV